MNWRLFSRAATSLQVYGRTSIEKISPAAPSGVPHPVSGGDRRTADLTILVASPHWANFPIVPHSLMELAAFMRVRGLPVEILETKANPNLPLSPAARERISRGIVRELERRRPAYVGLSCTTADYWCIRELAERIRSRIRAIIVVGGVHATLEPADFLYPGSPFDIVVVGEGEETLCEIVRSGLTGTALGDIRGIAYRRDGKMERTPPRPPIADLGSLPRPAYDLVDLEYYLKPNRFLIRALVMSGLQVYTSRGCPHDCTFCAGNMLLESQGLARAVRHRPVAQVIDTLRWLRESYGLESFYLADDTFAQPRSRALDFCTQYRESGLDMVWGAQTRVNLLDETLAAEFGRSNCVQLDFGVESGSDAALARMRKNVTAAETRRAVALCRKHRLRVFANIMFNTPGETEEDVRRTLDLMKEIKADHYGILLTVPFPGTRIFDERIGRGNLSVDEYRLFSHPDMYHRIYDPRLRLASHDLDLDRLYIKANLRFYFRNSLFEGTLGKWYRRVWSASRRKRQYVACYAATFAAQLYFYLMNFHRYVAAFVSRDVRCP